MDFKWNDDISVSNKIIDEHHMKLFNLFSKLSDDDKLLDEHSFKKVLMDIKDYTYYHFNYEERLMQMAKYPNLLEHKGFHIKFMDKIDDIMLEAKSNDLLVLADNTHEILKDWLVEHIMKVDKKYMDYLRDDI